MCVCIDSYIYICVCICTHLFNACFVHSFMLIWLCIYIYIYIYISFSHVHTLLYQFVYIMHLRMAWIFLLQAGSVKSTSQLQDASTILTWTTSVLSSTNLSAQAHRESGTERERLRERERERGRESTSRSMKTWSIKHGKGDISQQRYMNYLGCVALNMLNIQVARAHGLSHKRKTQ